MPGSEEIRMLIFMVCLCVLSVGNTGGATLTQPGSMSASLGEKVQVSCTLPSSDITAYTLLWFQYRLQSPPKYLLYYKDDSNQGKPFGISNRFSASKDATSTTYYLAISGIQAEDDGDYYCMTSKGGE